MASGSEKIMGLLKNDLEVTCSPRKKIDHELYTKVRSMGIKNRNMEKMYTKMVRTLGIGKPSL